MNQKILYIGDTEGISGYAQSARRVIFALHDAGANISVKYVPHDTNYSRDTAAINRVRSLYDSSGNVVIHQQIPHMFQPIRNAYNIGFTMFETTKIPEEWLPKLEQMDEIWVPSQFNKIIFSKSGLSKPIFVVPFPVDINLYTPGQKTNTTFRFLSIFQWTERKNWKSLLRAYFSEFAYSENTDLYLKVYASSDFEYEKQAIQNEIELIKLEVNNLNRPNLTLDFSIKTEQELAKIHQNSDVFVLPSRGEAIGLPYLESMACGNPCIATAWGGQTEFIDDSNGYLVDYELEPVGNMPHIKEYRRDQNWASVKIDDLKKQMRKAFSQRDQISSKRKLARSVVVSKFSCSVVTSAILDHLEKIPKYSIHNDKKQILPILYRGDIFGLSGYSSAIRLNLKILRQANIDVKIESVHHDRRQIENCPLKEMISSMSRYSSDSKILIDHQTPEFYKIDRNQYKIGVTYFETSKIPIKWVEKCNQMDEIWLSCENNKQVFFNSGVSSHIEIINPFIDTDHFAPNAKPLNIVNKSKLTFLSVFEFTQRKGWDVLVESFARAFSKNDNVCLILKTYQASMSENEIKLKIKNYLSTKNINVWPKILVYTQSVPYSAMPNLYAACDVFILPTRGESICYPSMEAMSCGKPCIITKDVGHSGFISDQNGYLINYNRVKVTNFDHSPWYTSDQEMAEPDVLHLVNIFKHVSNNRDELIKKGLLARDTIEKNHSIQKGFSTIIGRLRQICKKYL